MRSYLPYAMLHSDDQLLLVDAGSSCSLITATIHYLQCWQMVGADWKC
jgi:hypothetical protein